MFLWDEHLGEMQPHPKDENDDEESSEETKEETHEEETEETDEDVEEEDFVESVETT